MRLDINKAFFWLIKTPPGKKQKQKTKTPKQKEKEKKTLGSFWQTFVLFNGFVWHRIQFSKPKYKFCTYTAENCSNL